jgi:iron complex transport system substrate-binding protein
MSRIRNHIIYSLLAWIILVVPTAVNAAEVRVTDDLGQVIVLKEPAQRIISLYGAYSEILFAIGAGDRLVARTTADRFPPSILDKPSVGTHLRPNIELVLGLQPDLIIHAVGIKHGHEAIRQLQQKGLTVAVFQPRNFAELFAVIDRLGVLTGEEANAQALINAQSSRLREIDLRLAKSKDRPKVFFEVRYPNLLGAGQGSIVNDVILKAGGLNCLPNEKKLVRINIETLIDYDPDVYLVQKGPMNLNPGSPESRPNFQALKAVQQGRVFFVDEYLFSRPGPRSLEAVEQLSAYLHPEIKQ